MNNQKELAPTHTHSEEQNTNNNKSQDSEQLLEREKYPNTGFHVVGNSEQGYFVALGTYRITKMQTKEECAKMIDEKDYEIILGLIGASIEADKKVTAAAKKERETKYGK